MCEVPYSTGAEVHSWCVRRGIFFDTRGKPVDDSLLFHYNKHARFLVKGLRQPSAVATHLESSNAASEISLILFTSVLKILLSLVYSASILASHVCLLSVVPTYCTTAYLMPLGRNMLVMKNYKFVKKQ